MSTSYFHKNSFHYLEDYLMTKLNCKVKYFATRVQKGASIGACPMFQKKFHGPINMALFLINK
jgi:hypothetical protein